jgi:NDP-4-keto-2,6-dideoxyhexose 3-C-methyltransferase
MNPATRCRSCGSGRLTPALSLGEYYPSDFVPPGEERSATPIPIELALCESCTLVQARYQPDQHATYAQKYWFKSSSSPANREALADVARAVEARVPLKAGDVVLDIGSNDGTLLRSFTTPGVVRVGVEPAPNLAEEGSRGVDVLVNDFWSADAFWRPFEAEALSGRLCPVGLVPRARVILALGMLYDAPDPNPFIRDVAAVLAPGGVFVAQLMCLRQTLAMNDVGNLTHEHLLFFSLASLDALYRRHGLVIADVEENAVNGGSYRVWAQHADEAWSQKGSMWHVDPHGLRSLSAVRAESVMRLDRPARLTDFGWRVNASAGRLRDFVLSERAKGKRFWALGASTKGCLILQHAGLDASLIDACADPDPAKQGLVMAGSGVPVRSEEEFRQANPSYAIVLPYAFRKQIAEREAAWRAGGGRFVYSIPEFEVA